MLCTNRETLPENLIRKMPIHCDFYLCLYNVKGSTTPEGRQLRMSCYSIEKRRKHQQQTFDLL